MSSKNDEPHPIQIIVRHFQCVTKFPTQVCSYILEIILNVTLLKEKYIFKAMGPRNDQKSQKINKTHIF
jgi:hypothetical protein